MKLWHGVKKSSGTFFVVEEGECYPQGTQSIIEMGPSECSLRICKCMRRPIITFNPLSSICSACIVYTRMWVVEFLLEIFEMNFTIWSEFSKSKMLVWSEVNAWEDSSNYVWTEGGTRTTGLQNAIFEMLHFLRWILSRLCFRRFGEVSEHPDTQKMCRGKIIFNI